MSEALYPVFFQYFSSVVLEMGQVLSFIYLLIIFFYSLIFFKYKVIFIGRTFLDRIVYVSIACCWYMLAFADEGTYSVCCYFGESPDFVIVWFRS